MSQCIFCSIIQKKIPAQIVAESEKVIVIKDIHPKAPLHNLIIPKEHVVDVQSLSAARLSLMADMAAMAQKLSQDAGGQHFRLVINSGHDAGQRVFHLHMHYLAGTLTHEL